MRRSPVACAFIVCVHALTAACGSRAGVNGPPTTPPIDQPSAASTPPVVPAPATPSAQTPRLAEPVSDECALFASGGPARAESRNPITTIGLTDRIDPAHAPRPTNDSERLLFRQVYETLVRADCMGRVVPGLAASWRLDADRRTWIVTLRENARFSDGTPVTATDVRASWTGGGVNSSLRSEVARLVESVAETGDRTLAIRLRSPRTDVPMSLAHADLAVAKSSADSLWPLGTRSGWAAEGSPPSAITIRRDGLDALRFIVAQTDPRDLLDRGVDLLVTRSPAALDYAATLASFEVTPLAWQRTYVLLTPGRARGLPLPSDTQRQALAADAVRGEARAASAPFWWQTPDCGAAIASAAPADATASSGPRRQPPLAERIVYDAGDAVARDLAERLVGLGRTASADANALLDVLLPDRPRRSYQRAAGLSGDALTLARRRGADAGYVMAVDSRPIDPCRDLQVLTGDQAWVDPETIVPLVETRLRAISRRGRSGVTTDWDGALLATPSEPAPGASSGH